MHLWLLSLVRPALILWPLLAHAGLVVLLYVSLTVVRTRAVRAREVGYGSFEFSRDEPPAIARVSRNLSNQFELPVLFYAAVLILLHFQAVLGIDVAFAWLFVAGRVIHTAVQTLTRNVPLRGQVFAINFIGVVGLLAHIVRLALTL